MFIWLCQFICLVATSRLSCPVVCGTLVAWLEVKPTSQALEGRFWTTGPPGSPRFYISSWTSVGDLYISRNYFLCYWPWYPLFMLDFGNLYILSLLFFFIHLAKRLPIFVVFLKNQLLVSLIFSIAFLFFYFTDFCSNLSCFPFFCLIFFF